MAKIGAKDLRLNLTRLLRKHPDALLEYTGETISITKLHEEDLPIYRRPYYLPLGHIDSKGTVHLIAED